MWTSMFSSDSTVFNFPIANKKNKGSLKNKEILDLKEQSNISVDRLVLYLWCGVSQGGSLGLLPFLLNLQEV